MFQLRKEGESYPTPIKVRVPNGDKHIDQECTVSFCVLPSTEAVKLTIEGDGKFMAAAITGWEGISDADGKEIPCSPENIAVLAEIPYFSGAVIRAYFDRFYPRKNF